MAAARAFFYWPLMSLTQLLLPRKKWGRKKATTEATRTIGNRDAASQSPSSTCCVQDPFWITRSAHMLMAFWDDQQLSRKSVPYARDAWQPSFIWPSLANWVIKGFFKKAEKMHILGMLSKSPCRVWNLFSTKTFNYLVRSLIGMYWKEEAYLSSTKNAFQSSFSNIFWSTFLANLNRLMQISSVCKFKEFPAG